MAGPGPSTQMVWAISRPDQAILYPETDSRLWALTSALVTYEQEVGPKLSTIEGGRQDPTKTPAQRGGQAGPALTSAQWVLLTLAQLWFGLS